MLSGGRNKFVAKYYDDLFFRSRRNAARVRMPATGKGLAPGGPPRALHHPRRVAAYLLPGDGDRPLEAVAVEDVLGLHGVGLRRRVPEEPAARARQTAASRISRRLTALLDAS